MAMQLVRILAAAGAALAWPAAANACSMVPMDVHPSERSAALLVSATPDTAAAGPGGVEPSRQGGHSGPRRQGEIYGQVVQVERAGGPAAGAIPAGRAVLVPWDYDAACRPTPWGRSARWLPRGDGQLVLARLRRAEQWVDGLPTLDVFLPDVARPGAPDEPAPEVLFAYYAVLPTLGQLRADPWGAVEPVRAWLAANPAEAARPEMRWRARMVEHLASSFAARAEPSPLAGTYRFEVSRTGGSTHVFYGRTARHPSGALLDTDTATIPFSSAGTGYRMDVFFHLEPAGLRAPDAPEPGLEEDDEGTGDVVVRLPPVQGPGGIRRFAAWMEPVRFTGLFFREDRVLNEWATEMYVHSAFAPIPGEPAEVLLWPDGRVEWKQVIRVAPGHEITLRGERISDVAWENRKDGG